MRRDADVQESMAVLFTHVTRGDLAAVHEVVKEGEVHSTGCILQLSNELLEEDRLLEVAQNSLKASEKELIEYQQKEREGLHNLASCSRLASLVEGLADQTLDARKRLNAQAAEKHRRCALQLKTIESADLSEVMELKSSAVADRVYRVFVLCCMLLGVEIPEGSMVKKPEDPVGDAQVTVDKCKKKLERAQSLPDQPKATDTAEEVKTMLAEKQTAVDEAMAKMSDALEELETAKNRAEALKVNAITNVPTEREKKAKVKLRAQTWRACKKLLKMKPSIEKRLRFFAEGSAPIDDELVDLLRERYGDEACFKRDREKKGQFEPAAPPVVEEEEPEPDESHLKPEDRTTPEDRAAARAVKAAAKYANEVADRPPFFTLDGDTGTAVDAISNAEVEGYHVVGVLALFANAHIASCESAHAQKRLENTERQLRARFDDDRAPALLAAKRYAYVAHSRVKMVRDERDQWIKEVSFRKRRVRAWEGKVRAARVLQQYTPQGHSLLTWACCLGIEQIVEELLDHGACPGVPDVVLAEASRVVQLVFRHHLWRKEQRKRIEASAYARSATERAMRTRRETEHCFELARVLQVYKDKRGAHRVPLCEAAYNGNHECFEAFKRRKLLRGGSSLYETVLYPEAHFPYRRRQPEEVKSKYNVDECAKFGATDLRMMDWRHGVGWVAMEDEETQRTLTLIAAEEAWQGHLMAVKHGIQSRNDKVRTRKEREAHRAAVDALEEALRVDDFMRIGQIFDEGVVPVDHEDPSTGLTPLIAAAREDTKMETRKKCLNDAGEVILAVAFLLDRPKRRPLVDMENRWGNTALTMAICKGRADVVEALLDRGADVNRKSEGRKGWTPLRFAAERDKPKCVELLLLRGADPSMKGDDDRTPLDICVKRGHIEAQAALQRTMRGAFVGSVQKRDAALLQVCCAYGCGAFVPSEQDDPVAYEEHHAQCPKRPVTCKFCGDSELWAEELEAHLELYCKVRRIMECPLGCGITLREGDLSEHLTECKNRVIVCDWCGVEVFENSYKTHKDFRCPMRPRVEKIRPPTPLDPEPCELCGAFYFMDKVAPEAHDCPVIRVAPCPNKCGVSLRPPELQEHLKRECTHRWVPCERGCGLKIRKCDMRMHLDGPGPPGSRCGLVERYCDDCQQPVKLALWDAHQTATCPRRKVSCPLCGEEVYANELDKHKADKCPIRLVKCPNANCYKELPLNQMKVHATTECRKRELKCPQGCGLLMNVKRLARHMSHRCPKRYVECPLQCGARFRAEEETYHLTQQCVRRHAAAHTGDLDAPSPSKLDVEREAARKAKKDRFAAGV